MNLQASIRIPRRARDGETGDGIVDTVISYAKSESGTTPPSTGWASTLPTPTQGWYLWTRTVTTYRIRPATTTYSVSRYGEDGIDGAPGEDGADGEDGKDGKDGYTPIKGTDYFDGKDGQDGTSEHLHIRYSMSPDGSNFDIDPSNKLYIGIATSTTGVAPTLKEKYNWTLIKGSDGVKGEKGADGESRYLHIKYSDNGTSFTANMGETLGSWIGMYVDNIEKDSTRFDDYTWRKVDGEDGKDGADGADGKDGAPGKDGEDGKDGKDGASVEFGFRLSDTNSAPTKPTGALPNASWTYAMPLMTTSNRYLWITKRTKAQGSSTWSVWDTPVLHAYLPKDGEPGVGIPGTPGLPGQIPIQKEWVVGDTHRNTDEIVDFIYVRGDDKNTSYWYKLASKGTNDDVGAPPSHGTTPSGYERIDWLKELAVKVLIAEEANVAGFIHKLEKLFSQSGETYAGIPLAIDEYIEYNFANTASQPTVSSASWTDLPSGTIQWVRYKKNTESTWTVNRVGILANQWQLQFAIAPENETWYDSYSTNRFWMRYKTTDEDDYGKAVKITTAGGVDFIPNILIDGVTGRIEMLSAKIRGTIEATEGNLGGMTIAGDTLVSQNGRVVVDGANNAIYLLDENGSTKTVLRPDNIPSISSYFADSFNKTVDTTPITGSYTESYNQKQTVSFSLPTGSFEAIIPEMTLHVYATSASELGGGVSLRVELVSPSGVREIGSVSAWASGQFGSDDQSRTIPRRTLPISGSGACYLRVRLQNDSIGGSYATGTGSVSVSSNMVVNGVVNRSEIGNNGMMIATTRTSYNYMVGDTFEVRRGQNIFRLNEAGIKINKNGGTGIWADV